VGRPDLVTSDVGNPPAAVALGGSFPITDTTRNQSVYPVGASRVRYYLSPDPTKSPADRRMNGSRAVASLAAGGTSSGGASVVVPTNMTAGTYFVIACADDARQNAEAAIALFDQLGVRAAKADAYRVIGMVYRETGRPALAVALPGVDPVTTTLEMLPLMALYGLSIALVSVLEPRWRETRAPEAAPDV